MNNNNSIIKHILDVAETLNKNNRTFTRADLAYELKSKKFDIEYDSRHISELVYEAYVYYNYNDVIRNSFVDNAGRQLLIEEIETSVALDNNENDKALSIIECKLKEGQSALNRLQENIKSISSDSPQSSDINIIGRIKGTNGIESVQNRSKELMSSYSDLIACYENAENEIKECTEAFSEVRTTVLDIYRKYSTSLVDIFGPSIKVSMPKLFDFNSIEWLDISILNTNIELQFNQLNKKCNDLLVAIGDSFATSLKESASMYKIAGKDRTAGLILAGIGMIKHYMDASAKAASLEQDYLILRNCARRDATNIAADMSRLLQIYKLINDIYIPKAIAFCRNADIILNKEVKGICESLYLSNEAKVIKEERDAILDECHELERKITDEQINIDYYQQNIAKSKEVLDGMYGKYNDAKKSRPQKPSIVANAFTFGHAEKKFNKEMFEWNSNCGPVVEKYETLKVDVKLDSEELDSQKKLLAQDLQKLERVKLELNKNSEKMLSTIDVSDDIKYKILSHLNDVVKLLRLAKEISESKLDDKLISVNGIKDFGNLAIPADEQAMIDNFVNSFKNQLESNKNDDNSECNDSTVSEEQKLLSKHDQLLFENSVNLFEQYSKLMSLQAQDKKSEEHYQQQMLMIKKKFQLAMSKMDDKSNVLRNTIIKLNLTSNASDIKNALIELSDNKITGINDNEWNAFLKGDKEIYI